MRTATGWPKCCVRPRGRGASTSTSSTRLELTFSAKTYADLIPITADLHAVSHAPAATSPVPLVGGVPEVGHASSTAILGDRKRREVWQVPAHHAAFTLMGSIALDLREAVLTAPETTINANAIMGEIKIIIAAHMHTVVDGTPIMGDYGQGKDKVPADFRPDSPTSDSRESAGHSASAAIDALTIRAGVGLATCRDPGVARRGAGAHSVGDPGVAP